MPMATSQHAAMPDPIVVSRAGQPMDDLLDREWLIANDTGAYASGTVLGCNTRRYHGLLVAATAAPMGRIVALATVMEQVTVGKASYDLSTNEFPGAFSPEGMANLVEFRNDVWPTFVYRLGKAQLTKRVILADHNNAVAIQYMVQGNPCRVVLRPFVAMRDFHALRSPGGAGQMAFELADNATIVRDVTDPSGSLYLLSSEATFSAGAQWWRQFLYRAEAARGQDCLEDLYSPGLFMCDLADGGRMQLAASLARPISPDCASAMASRTRKLIKLSESVGSDADNTARRLAMATDTFIAKRPFPSAKSSTTILAGFPWFADWGRDAFISLPGLLLTTGRYSVAREVFQTFSRRISDGLIPNRFDDYKSVAHYNSVDASLWFILAAERYMVATNDNRFWRDTLMPAAEAILKAYQRGTKFDIHADADGLLSAGSADTQLTWMDAKANGRPVTPRHGKAVEINALWYCAHRVMASRSRGIDNKAAEHYSEEAEMIAASFVNTFWQAEFNSLKDCVRDGIADESIRPNQIFAVSAPYSPLSHDQQAAVLETVTEHLLTPMGLRTLSPEDPAYRGHYGHSVEDRDTAYHNGTVWPWLLGAYIEAYLKVHSADATAGVAAAAMLSAFDDHIVSAGLGQVSEICEGDRPHRPAGCIAQAWSVAEILRAKQLIAEFGPTASR